MESDAAAEWTLDRLSGELLELILSLADDEVLRIARCLSHSWRNAARSPLLPQFSTLSLDRFFALRGFPTGVIANCWRIHEFLAALARKPQAVEIDHRLDWLRESPRQRVQQLLEALPPTLTTLTLQQTKGSMFFGNDVHLHIAFLRGLDPLSRFTNLLRVDLSGVFNAKAEQLVEDGYGLARGAPLQLPPIPRLEWLAIGLWPREEPGRTLLSPTSLATNYPKLRGVACSAPAELLTPLRIECGMCNRVLYEALDDYMIAPPQQPHIGYEIYTSCPPVATAVAPTEGDDTRLQCAGRCHDRLWLIDHGSGIVDRCERPYAIACGPAGRGYPPLARAVDAEAPERTHRILRMGTQVGPREETLDEALTRLGREAAFQHSLGGHPLGGVFAGFGFGPG